MPRIPPPLPPMGYFALQRNKLIATLRRGRGVRPQATFLFRPGVPAPPASSSERLETTPEHKNGVVGEQSDHQPDPLEQLTRRRKFWRTRRWGGGAFKDHHEREFSSSFSSSVPPCSRPGRQKPKKKLTQKVTLIHSGQQKEKDPREQGKGPTRTENCHERRTTRRHHPRWPASPPWEAPPQTARTTGAAASRPG